MELADSFSHLLSWITGFGIKGFHIFVLGQIIQIMIQTRLEMTVFIFVYRTGFIQDKGNRHKRKEMARILLYRRAFSQLSFNI